MSIISSPNAAIAKGLRKASLRPPAAIHNPIGTGLIPKKLARGGTGGSAMGISDNMFQPINPMATGVPDAGINFIVSPQLQMGSGPGRAVAPPVQQQNPTAEAASGISAANGAASLYNKFASPSVAGAASPTGVGQWMTGSGSNPSIAGSIQSGLSGNGFGGILTGPNAQSSIGGISNGFAPGASLDTLGSGATAAASAAPTATGVGAAIDASAADAGAAALTSTATAAAADAGATAATTAAASSIPEWLAAAFALLADGGAVPQMAGGGDVPGIDSLSNMLMRREAGENFHPGGLLSTKGPGRTDNINTTVPSGNYIIPADVVSGLGEGSTLSGSAVLDRMMHTSPYGIDNPKLRGGRGAGVAHAEPQQMPQTVDQNFIKTEGAYADGGAPGEKSDKTPVVLAGGEYNINRDAIIQKFGSLKRGHKILDEFVKHIRQRTIKEMSKLPGPKK